MQTPDIALARALGAAMREFLRALPGSRRNDGMAWWDQIPAETETAHWLAAAVERVALNPLSELAARIAAAVMAEREAIAAEIDCGCAARQDVLAALDRGERPTMATARYCPAGTNCRAVEARAIRARPAPPECGRGEAAR